MIPTNSPVKSWAFYRNDDAPPKRLHVTALNQYLDDIYNCFERLPDLIPEDVVVYEFDVGFVNRSDRWRVIRGDWERVGH